MKKIFVLLFCLALGEAVVNAAGAVWVPDADLVDRAELIVVGHLEADSIQYIHRQSGLEHFWEHHATLLVSEVIKGQCSSNNVPIIIPSGFVPIVGGYVNHENHGGFMMDIRRGNTNYPTNLLQIVRDGDSVAINEPPAVEDGSKNNIWFLRRGHSILEETSITTSSLGGMVCYEIQPLNMEEYFKLYLGPHRENALRTYAAKHSELAGRIQVNADYVASQQAATNHLDGK